jgi:hypothetical protein
MKSIFKITLIIFSIISVLGNRVDASHMMGGEITWTCVGQDSFLITVVFHRD